jgi:hypothetical protein
METESVSLNQIRRNLFKIPLERLHEVSHLVEVILKETDSGSVRHVERMEGIWEGIGFEQLSDLDKDIREIRGFSEKILSERITRWNT